MRALLASPLGFLIGLSLGALGAGGSIVAVPALVYVAGQDPKAATTSSLILVGVAATIGLGSHLRVGHVRVGTGLAFGLAGVGGSLAGSGVNRHVDPDVLLLGFSALVLIAAWRMFVGCPTCTKVGEERSSRSLVVTGGVLTRTRLEARQVVLVLVAGSAVGFLTGLFGVGGGFVIVPALALVLRLPMPEAIGTSLIVIAINCGVALASRLATTSVDWALTAPFALTAIAGVIAGGRLADRLDPERSLGWFAGILVVVALYTAVRSGVGLR